jgi:hypothetical protein
MLSQKNNDDRQTGLVGAAAAEAVQRQEREVWRKGGDGVLIDLRIFRPATKMAYFGGFNGVPSN